MGERKTIYLECLTSMSSLSLTQGEFNIFSWRTRSRSGKTEEKVKLGLISSVIEAQRLLLQNGSDKKKKYVVPFKHWIPLCIRGKQPYPSAFTNRRKGKFVRKQIQPITFRKGLKFLKDMFTRNPKFICLLRTLGCFLK